MAEILSLEEHATDVAHNVRRKLEAYSPQLWLARNLKEPIRFEALGTAVLLKFGSSKFLVTAGHTFGDRKHDAGKIGLAFGDHFYTLPTTSWFYDNKGTSTSSKLDLSVCKLDKDLILSIEKKYRFLDVSDIEQNHNLLLEKRYLLYGYPLGWSQSRGENLPPKPKYFSYLTTPTINNLGEHIHLKFKKEKFDPEPRGMSGSGLWYIPKFENSNIKFPLKLIGIMISWEALHSRVTATRIDYVMQIIRQHFQS